MLLKIYYIARFHYVNMCIVTSVAVVCYFVFGTMSCRYIIFTCKYVSDNEKGTKNIFTVENSCEFMCPLFRGFTVFSETSERSCIINNYFSVYTTRN